MRIRISNIQVAGIWFGYKHVSRNSQKVILCLCYSLRGLSTQAGIGFRMFLTTPCWLTLKKNWMLNIECVYALWILLSIAFACCLAAFSSCLFYCNGFHLLSWFQVSGFQCHKICRIWRFFIFSSCVSVRVCMRVNSLSILFLLSIFVGNFLKALIRWAMRWVNDGQFKGIEENEQDKKKSKRYKIIEEEAQWIVVFYSADMDRNTNFRVKKMTKGKLKEKKIPIKTFNAQALACTGRTDGKKEEEKKDGSKTDLNVLNEICEIHKCV